MEKTTFGDLGVCNDLHSGMNLDPHDGNCVHTHGCNCVNSIAMQYTRVSCQRYGGDL